MVTGVRLAHLAVEYALVHLDDDLGQQKDPCIPFTDGQCRSRGKRVDAVCLTSGPLCVCIAREDVCKLSYDAYKLPPAVNEACRAS